MLIYTSFILIHCFLDLPSTLENCSGQRDRPSRRFAVNASRRVQAGVFCFSFLQGVFVWPRTSTYCVNMQAYRNLQMVVEQKFLSHVDTELKISNWTHLHLRGLGICPSPELHTVFFLICAFRNVREILYNVY